MIALNCLCQTRDSCLPAFDSTCHFNAYCVSAVCHLSVCVCVCVPFMCLYIICVSFVCLYVGVLSHFQHQGADKGGGGISSGDPNWGPIECLGLGCLRGIEQPWEAGM